MATSAAITGAMIRDLTIAGILTQNRCAYIP